MDYDKEAINYRRQLRQQQRQQRLAQRRKLLLRLGIAFGVLVLVGVLIAVISAGGKNPPRETVPTQTVSPVQTNPADGTQSPQTVIRFAAAGDLNITDRVVASGGVNYDYTRAFLGVVPLLAGADLTAVNFEGNAYGSQYGADSAPPQMLTALKTAGVDLLQMANSRTINKGVAGLQSTLQSVRGAGLIPVGAFADSEEYKQSGGYTICDVKGVKVAVVAFTKGMDGMALPAGSENCVNLLYTDYSSNYRKVDKEGITKLLRAIEKQKPDVTIALLHWGSEYNDTHSDSQEDIRELMTAEGVDAIIGTHPHYVQEMEFDPQNGTFIAYSLGDFFGDATRSGTEYSVVLELEITKDNVAGTTAITGYSYTPIYIAEDSTGALRVLRMEQAIAAYESNHIDRVSQSVYESMLYARDRIANRINPEKK